MTAWRETDNGIRVFGLQAGARVARILPLGPDKGRCGRGFCGMRATRAPAAPAAVHADFQFDSIVTP